MKDSFLAYLAWACFADARDADKTPQTLGLIAKEGSVIYRADGMSFGIEAARRFAMGLGNLMWSAT
jgi:hypothetical protein